MKVRAQEAAKRGGLLASGVGSNGVEKSPEARGLSQTERDPARTKRNASRKTNGRCSANGQAGESSSLHVPPSEASANNAPNDREIPGKGKAASDDANGTTAAGAAPSHATCAVRDACAEVAEPRPNGAARDEESGSEMNRRPRARGDSKLKKVPVVSGVGDPLALDAPGFVDEMHLRANLYAICKELLKSGDEKLRQRTWERLLEMKYGKGAGAPAEEVPRVDVEFPPPER